MEGNDLQTAPVEPTLRMLTAGLESQPKGCKSQAPLSAFDPMFICV